MTNRDQEKLHTIIGKLEHLQNTASNLSQKEIDAMRNAKKKLLEILNA